MGSSGIGVCIKEVFISFLMAGIMHVLMPMEMIQEGREIRQKQERAELILRREP